MKKLYSLFFLFLLLPTMLQAQYPSLDQSFNEFTYEGPQVVIKVQQDGKILILERGKITRLEKDGTPDVSFGNEGTVSGIETSPSYFSYQIPSTYHYENPQKGNLYIQEDGKIVIGGGTSLTRLTPDGNLDNTFGVNGYVNFEVPLDYSGMHTHEDLPITPFTFADLGFQSDGKIIVAGSSTIPTEEPIPPFIAVSPWDTFSLFRFNSDGSPDVNFGNNGHMLVPVRYPSGTQISGYLSDMKIQQDDKIVLGGKGFGWAESGGFLYPFNENVIFRLHPDGELDQDFNNGNMIFPQTPGSGLISWIENVEIQKDLKIVIKTKIDEFNRPSEVIRINPDGSLDPTFAQNGILSLPVIFEPDWGVLLKNLPNGDLLIFYHGVIQLIKPDGTIDSNFGEDGLFKFPFSYYNFGGFNPWVFYMDFQHDNLIVTEVQSKIIKRYFLYESEPEPIAVQKFTLINAQTNEELFELEDGQVINLQEIGTNEINIRAYTDPEPTGSVSFNLTGAQTYSHIENNAYYALFANAGEDFFSWVPVLGVYSLTATPYTESNAQGEPGTPLTISFTIIDEEKPDIAVTRFTLINALTNQELFELEDGQVINLQQIGTNEINIRAYTDPEPTGSVRFSLSGAEKYSHIENNAYYALYLNAGEDFFSWSPALGTYILTATPFSESNAQGETGTPLTISFTIIDEELPGLRVEKFTLYNAVTDQELFELTDGHIIDLQEIGTNEINIRAYTDPEPTGSVRFNLTGAQNYTHTENNAYYALFQNLGEDFFSWTPSLGNYQLTATPYSEANAQGEAGSAMTISFSIVNSTEDNLRMATAYPNPGTDILNIPVPFPGASSIIILDLTGKDVKLKTNPSLQGNVHVSLDVSDLDKKAYIIKIIDANEVRTLRWVKQ